LDGKKVLRIINVNGGFVLGVPLSNYTVLKYIADSVELNSNRDQRQSIEMELALDSLKEYSVYAFIIHDPEVHHEFHSFLEKQFQSLHYSSGEHLVFFGLVDSTRKLTLVGRRPFYQDIRDMITSFEDEAKKKSETSYSAFALVNNLKIDPEMLPAIIVTHDTRLTSFRYYKTCPNEIEKQFNRLTSISYQMNIYTKNASLSIEEKQDILYNLLDKEEINLCKGMGITRLTETMARALSNLMSFLVEDGNDYGAGKIREIAENQRSKSINNIINCLKKLKRDIEFATQQDIESHQLFPIIEELNIKLAVFLKMFSKRNQTMDILPIENEWLDPYSKKLLLTGLEVANYLQSNESDLDFSASTICLAKMFEREINNSFVHWLRKENSIQLPQYYNKVQPRVNAFVTTNFPTTSNRLSNNNSVNLNKSINGKWQPPELGKSMYIAKYNLSETEWGYMEIKNPNAFIKDWSIIHSIRNMAAHTDEVTLKDFNSMVLALKSIAENHVFKKMSLMKKSFKGDYSTNK
jgi:hypothetical protein